MTRAGVLWIVLMTCPMPSTAAAQSATAAESRLWLAAGGGSSTVRGDCQACETDYPYRHGANVLANVGYRVNERTDIGAEIFWAPIGSETGRIRATHVDAIAQVRPWRTHGFFLKGGAGMAFIRNWVDTQSSTAINSKALSVVVGGGWSYRVDRRVGVELFVSQHAAALGDFQTSEGDVTDVIGNYWSFGAALVFR